MNNKILDLMVSKVDELVMLSLTKGVQPYELAENAFDEDYREIKIKRAGNTIKTEVTIYEEIDLIESRMETLLSYTYDLEGNLNLIEEFCDNKKKILWSREHSANTLISEIVALLQEINPQKIDQFIESLPGEYKKAVSEKLNLVA